MTLSYLLVTVTIGCRYRLNECPYSQRKIYGSRLIANNTPALSAEVLSHQHLSFNMIVSMKDGTKKNLARPLLSVPIFSSSATGNTGAVRRGVCRTLVLVTPLDLCSQRQFSQVVDHSLDHLSLKYVLVI